MEKWKKPSWGAASVKALYLKKIFSSILLYTCNHLLNVIICELETYIYNKKTILTRIKLIPEMARHIWREFHLQTANVTGSSLHLPTYSTAIASLAISFKHHCASQDRRHKGPMYSMNKNLIIIHATTPFSC